MRNLAEIIVQSGFAVTTLDLCNMKLWNGQHRQNALEMIATARHWGIDRVVYAGFSAGALAALGAAARDSNTQGLLLLDFVDRAPIGERALSTLSAPVYALNGEPAPCNAHGRGMQLFTTGITVEKIPGASHCAFESPSDTVCRLLCRANNTIDEQARKDINRRVVDSIIRLEITGSFTSN